MDATTYSYLMNGLRNINPDFKISPRKSQGFMITFGSVIRRSILFKLVYLCDSLNLDYFVGLKNNKLVFHIFEY